MTYPPFRSPCEFFHTKQRLDWTQKEAQAFFEWLLSIADARTDDLVKHLGIGDLEDPRELLSAAGARAEAILQQHQGELARTVRRLGAVPAGSGESTLARVGSFELTEQGNGLAVDMALLTVRLLLTNFAGSLKWTLVTAQKRDNDFHLPVIAGKGHITFGPLTIGPRVAISVLKGSVQGAAAWLFYYDQMGVEALVPGERERAAAAVFAERLKNVKSRDSGDLRLAVDSTTGGLRVVSSGPSRRFRNISVEPVRIKDQILTSAELKELPEEGCLLPLLLTSHANSIVQTGPEAARSFIRAVNAATCGSMKEIPFSLTYQDDTGRHFRSDSQVTFDFARETIREIKSVGVYLNVPTSKWDTHARRPD